MYIFTDGYMNQGLKIENLRACLFVYIKVRLRAFGVRYYFVHAKILYVYSCTQCIYVIVVFMNAHNLHFTLNTFLSSLFTYFNKMLRIYFC